LLSLHTRVDRQGKRKSHQRVNHPPATLRRNLCHQDADSKFRENDNMVTGGVREIPE
jgi:hypothetical protein